MLLIAVSAALGIGMVALVIYARATIPGSATAELIEFFRARHRNSGK